MTTAPNPFAETAEPSLRKTAEAKLVFEQPQQYFNRRAYDIQIRRETVQEFTEGREFTRILDIGCGDGSISLPLLNSNRHLTLLDMSSSMLALAESKVPVSLRNNLAIVNENFMTTNLAAQAYDLVICLGVLAHVDSVEDIVAKIATVLKPSGLLILEFTDSFHFWGRIDVAFQKVWNRVRPVTYELNRLSREKVINLCTNSGFRKSAEYRYAPPPPGLHRLVSQRTLYRLTRNIFGSSRHNRAARFGNESICRFERA